ncbi:glycoside hydrolase family 3 protein [Nakamurella lactea]|uniref:glycoside hydrolase family 3 protein n=1 Tax=Nakamurella lactea TaxID=459515 RepID=UPI00040D84E1|nr:glycoside hydrolase family 3 protein [Nakamurella lactea]
MATATAVSLLMAGSMLAPAASAAASAPSAPVASEISGSSASAHQRPDLSELLGRIWARNTLRHMTIQEKVGQLFSTHVYGTTVDSSDPNNVAEYGLATPREIIAKYHLGGVLYFAWTHSVDNPIQAAGLSNGIQRVALSTGAHVPMLMSIDQEGGLVTRMLEPATQTPGAMALGATRDADGARDIAAIQGKELAAVGVRQNFAPVADVNVNPDNPVIGVRSFGSDPTTVARLTAAQVRGYQDDAGISSAAKHFPGHGDTDVDSHYGFPVINHTRQQWDEIDKPPFEAAIKAGIDVIMTAHIQVPALDQSGDPATLSKPILTGILRGELGFKGVIVTDSLGMQGVRDKYGDARVPVLALKAGADILLNPPDLDVAYNGVLSAVASGELTTGRIDESVTRVLMLKWRNGTVLHPLVNERKVPAIVGIQPHLDRVQQVTDDSTTVLSNDGGTLPLAVSGKKILVTGYGVTTKQTLADKLAERGADPSIAATSTNPTDAQISGAVAAAGATDATVVLTMNAAASPGQAKLVAALRTSGATVIVAAVRNPYDVAEFPDVPTYLATYSYQAVAIESLVRVIVGEVGPTGTLPVAVPEKGGGTLYPLGAGLTW